MNTERTLAKTGFKTNHIFFLHKQSFCWRIWVYKGFCSPSFTVCLLLHVGVRIKCPIQSVCFAEKILQDAPSGFHWLLLSLCSNKQKSPQRQTLAAETRAESYSLNSRNCCSLFRCSADIWTALKFRKKLFHQSVQDYCIFKKIKDSLL